MVFCVREGQIKRRHVSIAASSKQACISTALALGLGIDDTSWSSGNRELPADGKNRKYSIPSPQWSPTPYRSWEAQGAGGALAQGVHTCLAEERWNHLRDRPAAGPKGNNSAASSPACARRPRTHTRPLVPRHQPQRWGKGRCVGKAPRPRAARGSPSAGATSGRVRGGLERCVGRPWEAQEGPRPLLTFDRFRIGFAPSFPYASVSLRRPPSPPLRRPPPQPRKTSGGRLVPPDSPPLDAAASPLPHQPRFHPRYRFQNFPATPPISGQASVVQTSSTKLRT